MFAFSDCCISLAKKKYQTGINKILKKCFFNFQKNNVFKCMREGDIKHIFNNGHPVKKVSEY